MTARVGRDHPLMLTVEEVATQLHMGRGRAYELIGSGELVSVKIGGRRRVRWDDLAAYVNSLPAAPPSRGAA